MNRAIFMDRDGTISYEVGYVNHPSRYKIFPFSGRAIQLINASPFLAIVVTNQAGVARGYFTEDLIPVVHEKLKEQLAEEGAYLDAIYYCPHHPNGTVKEYAIDCPCRKPNPGLLFKAKEDFNIDLEHSYVIGDKISDVELAKRVGATGVMVLTGYGLGEYTYQREQWKVEPDFIAENLLEAVEWILHQERIYL